MSNVMRPVANAHRMMITAIVANRTSPSRASDPLTTASTMSVGTGGAETAPGKPLLRAITRQAAKQPNRTRPTPWEAYGARGPEKTSIARGTSPTTTLTPDTQPTVKASSVLFERTFSRRLFANAPFPSTLSEPPGWHAPQAHIAAGETIAQSCGPPMPG